MIKANELRIGNLLFMHGILVKVTSINENGFTVEPLQQEYVIGWTIDVEWHGVPLTHEILEMCGFEYIETGVYGYCDKNHIIYPHKNDEWRFNIFCANDDDCAITIKYIHQLQNLYFALMGEEIEIKLPMINLVPEN